MTSELVRQLIAEHKGDATVALLAVAFEAGIAVAYLDREYIEGSLGKLSDEEWEAVRPYLSEFDEWLTNSGASDSIGYFVGEYLPEKAGLAPRDES